MAGAAAALCRPPCLQSQWALPLSAARNAPPRGYPKQLGPVSARLIGRREIPPPPRSQRPQRERANAPRRKTIPCKQANHRAPRGASKNCRRQESGPRRARSADDGCGNRQTGKNWNIGEAVRYESSGHDGRRKIHAASHCPRAQGRGQNAPQSDCRLRHCQKRSRHRPRLAPAGRCAARGGGSAAFLEKSVFRPWCDSLRHA